MSDTQTSNSAGANSAKNAAAQVVIVKQKSAMVGFLLAFVGLGWFGIDRFYKGDILLGFVKLVLSINSIIMITPGIIWLSYVLNADLSFLDIIRGLFEVLMSGNANSSIVFVAFCVLAVFHFFVWWPLDFILVPLGIARDNKRKLAKIGAKVV